MDRRVTAIYRTYDTATLVRDKLERLGIARHHITVVPDADQATTATRTAPTDPAPGTMGTAGAAGTIDPATPGGAFAGATPGYGVAAPAPAPLGHPAYAPDGDDREGPLRDLGLPDDDLRTYRDAIRNGDHVVSVEVDEATDLAQVQQIMRQPEEAVASSAAAPRRYAVARGPGAGSSDRAIESGTHTVTALFDTQVEAGDAVNRLRSAGIPASCIRVVPTPSERQDLTGSGRGDGSDARAGFWDQFDDFSLPDEDRESYAEALARGSFLVAVHDFDASQHDTVLSILDTDGAVDLDAREEEWRASGWSGRGSLPASGGSGGAKGGASGRASGRDPDARMQDGTLQMAADDARRGDAGIGTQQHGRADRGAMRQPGTLAASDRAGADDESLEIVEERLRVDKRDVEGGRVRVRSYVREVPVSADVDLRAQRVHLERRPVDRAATAGDLNAGDRTLEAREFREEPVIAKEARVVEEIGLRQETEVEHQHVEDTVRKTEVEIEDERPRADRDPR